ncbi:MAG: tripartite tricarboxylate transporter substrate binding protein [Burkholderiales bacterium]|nr:tripartite tricarboxylate transporter substrate binding protein [Burkholderiales bacterium]
MGRTDGARRARKHGCRLIAAALLALAAAGAIAQDYPSRVIRFVVPFPPAGSSDNYARLLAKELQASWGQPTVVENRAGATGQIGSDFVKRAAPDGYTLLFTSNTSHILGPLLQNPRPFDAVADFTPVSKVLRFPLYLVIHPSIPAKSLKEFIAFGRARPGQLVFSSSGQGGVSHLVTELFNDVAGIKGTHVPFKGTWPAVMSVMAGETHYIFNNIGVSQPLVAAGKLRGLAVTGEKRSPALPDMPTAGEMGIRGLEDAYTWLGLLGPAHLPPAVLDKLAAEVVRIARTPEMEKRILNDGYVPVANTPAQFRSEIRSEIATWSRVIKERGIKAQ